MAWGAADNIVPELGRLNTLLLEHPCFYDGATITRISPPESTVLALTRLSAETVDKVLVLVNTDAARKAAIEFDAVEFPAFDHVDRPARPVASAMSRSPLEMAHSASGWRSVLPLSSPTPVGLHGEAYGWRERGCLGVASNLPDPPRSAPRPLPAVACRSRRPFSAGFLASVRQAALLAARAEADEKHFALEQGLFRELLAQAEDARGYASVVRWSLRDSRRVMPVPWPLAADRR